MAFGIKKEKKAREVQGYKPPRELGIIGNYALVVMGCLMIAFGLVGLSMGVFGETTTAVPYTQINEAGEVVAQNLFSGGSTLYYTFTDKEGVLRQGYTNLLGNEEMIGDTIEIVYLPFMPSRTDLASRSGIGLTQLGCLLLGMILISTGWNRAKVLKKKAEAGDTPADNAVGIESAEPAGAPAPSYDPKYEFPDEEPGDKTE